MSYFPEIVDEARLLRDWADLRHGQGCDVRLRIEEAITEMRRLMSDLEQITPPADLVAREPDSLSDIQAARPDGPRKLWEGLDIDEHLRRVEGAWLGRAAGCTLGAIVEGWSIQAMDGHAANCGMSLPPTDYWTQATDPGSVRYNLDRRSAYARSQLRYVPVDDDLVYTLLGLLILEDYGPDFSTEQVGQAWLKYLPHACTAEEITLANLRAGLDWQQAAAAGNPYVEWIGADIRADPWAYAAPGWPEKAAEFAWRDACLSHRHNGVYGEMYFAAAISAAFAVDDPLDACRIALSEIPAKCRLQDDLTWAIDASGELTDFRQARSLVDDRFDGMSGVHTNNNACLTIFGLALGGRDVTAVIGNTVAMGLDNDCTAATAGSIVGAAVGKENIPKHWYMPFGGKAHSYINGHEWFDNADIVARFAYVARAIWQA